MPKSDDRTEANIVLVFDPSERVLVLRRSRTDPWRPFFWNFPGGFRSSEDQTSRDAAVRELREEAGVFASPMDLTPLFSLKTDVTVHVWQLTVAVRPRVTLPDREHDQFAWCWMSCLPIPNLPSVRAIQSQSLSRSTRC